MKIVALTTFIAASLILGGSAALAMDEATKAAVATCQNAKTAADKGIAACTTVLNGVKLGPQSRLQIYYNRGAFNATAGNKQKAAEDYTQAINAYEQDPDKANWPVDFTGVAASSYAMRAQVAAKCEDAKSDYKKAAEVSREVSERSSYERLSREACK